MEAKDTVMKDEQIKVILLEVADRYYDAETQVTVSHTSVAKAQAEVSFKAGIKEVVEFMESHHCGLDACDMELQIWQAKLKEWEVRMT